MGRTPPKGVQRSIDMSGSSPPACELPVLRRTNDDLKITIRPPVCTVVGDSTTSGGAMLRNLTIMESINEEAGTRARDSAPTCGASARAEAPAWRCECPRTPAVTAA